MKKLLALLIMLVLTFSVLAGCGEGEKAQDTAGTEGTKAEEVKKDTNNHAAEDKGADKKDIKDLVTMKEVVNREVVRVDGSKGRYVYEIPIINIDKPGARKINEVFLNLEKYMENHIGGLQNYVLVIKPEAFLNEGIISIVMNEGPHGIFTGSYDIENDKEIDTKELMEKFRFDPKRLIAEIDKQTEIDSSKPSEDQRYRGDLIKLFAITIIENDSLLNTGIKLDEEMKRIENMTGEEAEAYVVENIDKLKAYVNNEGKFVFIHAGQLDNEVLVIE